MNDCLDAELRDQLPDFVQGTLDAAATSRVAAHLATCPACTAEVAMLRSARMVLRRAPAAANVRRIVGALPKPVVARERNRPRFVAPRFQAQRWRVAAAVVLTLTGATTLWIARHDGRTQAPPVTVAAGSGNAADRKAPDAVQPVTAAGLSLAGGFEGLTDEDLTTLLDELGRYDVFPDSDGDTDTGALAVEDAL